MIKELAFTKYVEFFRISFGAFMLLVG